MKDICEITSSKRIFAAEYKAEGVPFYRGKEISEKFKGALDVTTELFIDPEKFRAIQAKFGAPEEGDLLLTSVGTLGSPYVVRPGESFYFKDGNLTWFRKFNGLESKFLYYWLLSPQGRAELKKCTIGSSQSAYTIVLLKEMEINLPDLPTQRKIAGILSAYDDLIENNLRRIKILEEMAQSLYREWFVHFRFPGHESARFVDSPLGRIPEGWEVKALGGIAEFRLGKMLDKKKNKGELMPYLANVNVRWGRFELDELRKMRFTTDELDAYGLRAGDIVMCEGGEPGRCAVWKEQIPGMMIQKAIHRIRCREDMDHSFLYQNLLHLGQSGYLASLFTGATIKHLPREQLAKVKILVPPKALLDAFIKFVRPAEDQVTRLEATITCATKSRDLLLPKLLGGKDAS